MVPMFRRIDRTPVAPVVDGSLTISANTRRRLLFLAFGKPRSISVQMQMARGENNLLGSCKPIESTDYGRAPGQGSSAAGRFEFPVSAGSDGQWGANNSTAGVYPACVKLREAIAQKLGQSNFPSMVVELPGRDGDSSFQGMDARRDAAKREYHSPWFREMEGVLLQARDLSGCVILSTGSNL
jgi:hypothetical protein